MLDEYQFGYRTGFFKAIRMHPEKRVEIAVHATDSRSDHAESACFPGLNGVAIEPYFSRDH